MYGDILPRMPGVNRTARSKQEGRRKKEEGRRKKEEGETKPRS
jgi:hypothetical protein